MYTISEASARTGVGSPLIRAWERRYGVIDPARTASGYRLYDDASLRIIGLMRSLVATGWTASEAARAIKTGEVTVDHSLADEAPVARPEGGPASAVAMHQARLIQRFVSAAESASAGETEAALDDILLSGSFEAVVDDILLPAVAALGDAWASGRLSVAAEHAASAAVARRLSAVFLGAGTQAGATVVIVGLPPGSRHELGAFAFAATLRRRGTGVLYLGSDVTVEGWVDAATRTRARAAVVGVVTEGDQPAAAEVVTALRAAGVRTVAFGGRAAQPASGPGDDRGSVLVMLPTRVVAAAEVIARAIRRG
jgi:DNA-binding transcriptional MerR regulator/methylmalonyl-CoA mutase cobalamin-binding subunit